MKTVLTVFMLKNCFNVCFNVLIVLKTLLHLNSRIHFHSSKKHPKDIVLCILFLDSGINSPCVLQKYKKFANFTGLYFFHYNISQPNFAISPTLECSLILW